MSHLLAYVIDLPGRGFIPLLAPAWRPTEADLQELVETDSLWDGRLLESPVDFSIELSGEATIVWLTTRYSNFIADPIVQESVAQWERDLTGLVDARVVRVDEFLLNEWETNFGDRWFREKGAFSAFFEWIMRKPRESWQLL